MAQFKLHYFSPLHQKQQQVVCLVLEAPQALKDDALIASS